MKIGTLLLLLAWAALARTEILVLDDSNFTTFLAQHSFVFVEFYSPTCSHCRDLQPEFELLGALAEDKNYFIAKVDSTVARKTSEAHEIQSYPTLKFFANGFSIDYRGERTGEKMLRWIDSYFTKRIASISDAQIAERRRSEHLLVIQGEDPEKLRILEYASFLDQSVKYYKVVNDRFRVTLHLRNSAESIDFTGNLTASNLNHWTYVNTLSGLVLLDSEEALNAVFVNAQKVSVFLLYRAPDLSQEVMNRLESICYDNRPIFKCCYVESGLELYRNAAKYLRVANQNASSLVFLQYGLKFGYKYPDVADASNESIHHFLEHVGEGRVEPLIDTQKEKADRISRMRYNNVIRLVDETYEQTLRENMYVLIKYYSPSSEESVAFAAEYERLATKVKEEGLDFIIASVDLDEQEEIGEEIQVNNLPSLRFYVNGSQFEYLGSRQSEDILIYLTKAASSRLLTAASVDDIPKPSVALFGIDEIGELHVLPFFFTALPVYHIKGQGQFKVQVFTKTYTQSREAYFGLSQLLYWIEQAAEPLIVKIADERVPKKLSVAIESQHPLLVLIKRDGAAEQVLSVFQKYCRGRFTVLCSQVSREDFHYQSFNRWLYDSKPNRSGITMIDTLKWKNYNYVGELEQVTPDRLNRFVEAVIAKIKRGDKAEAKEEKPGEQPVEKQAKKQDEQREVPKQKQQREKLRAKTKSGIVFPQTPKELLQIRERDKEHVDYTRKLVIKQQEL